MNIYRIAVPPGGAGTYESAVVVAATAEDARRMHPSGKDLDGCPWISDWDDTVTAHWIGTAWDDTPPHVVCAAFNAGQIL